MSKIEIINSAKISTENNGIVFLDEIDKVSARGDRVGGDVSREGVQRDLLTANRRNIPSAQNMDQ